MKMAFALALVSASVTAQAATVEVKMKTRGAAGMMVFEPAYVKAAVGDTIRFIPTEPSHNAKTIDGMLPPGGARVEGQINQPVDLKLTAEGLYGVECKPHLGMGMVALVQAGRPVNLAAVKAVKLPPLAARRMTANLAQVK